MSNSGRSCDDKLVGQEALGPQSLTKHVLTKTMDPSALEALFDSGYSTGDRLLSSNDWDSNSASSIRQSSPSLNPSKTTTSSTAITSDSGLCIDSSCNLEYEGEDVDHIKTTLPSSLVFDASSLGPESLLINEETGNSMLHLAIVRGVGDLAMALIQKAIHPDLLDIRNGQGETPLHLAAITGQAKILRRLLVSGATIDLRNFSGETALHIACRMGDLESCKAVLKPISPSEVIEASLDHYMPQIHGSNMLSLMHDMNYEGQTCVHLAAESGNRRLLEYMHSLGGNFNVREGKSGWTCLHWAVSCFRTDMVHLLLTIRADANVRDYSGRTPLNDAMTIATQLNRLEKQDKALTAAIRCIVLMLLEAGGSPGNKSEEEEEEDDDHCLHILSHQEESE